MISSKRDFLKFAGTTVGGAVCTPSLARSHARRISQAELDAAVAHHALWLTDRTRGARAVFANCDLSGLSLSGDADDVVDLRGADFTEADLSGITGRLINFRRVSLQYARMSWSRLAEPGFIDADLRGARCDNAVWGLSEHSTPDTRTVEAGEGAMMHNCDAAESDFTHARLRGHFLDTRFNHASLVDADLSCSRFLGTGLQETSFSRANLTRARFDHAKLDHVRFSRATLDGAAFDRAEIGYRVILPPIEFNRAPA